jgi:hypothetical protein
MSSTATQQLRELGRTDKGLAIHFDKRRGPVYLCSLSSAAHACAPLMKQAGLVASRSFHRIFGSGLRTSFVRKAFERINLSRNIFCVRISMVWKDGCVKSQLRPIITACDPVHKRLKREHHVLVISNQERSCHGVGLCLAGIGNQGMWTTNLAEVVSRSRLASWHSRAARGSAECGSDCIKRLPRFSGRLRGPETRVIGW